MLLIQPRHCRSTCPGAHGVCTESILLWPSDIQLRGSLLKSKQDAISWRFTPFMKITSPMFPVGGDCLHADWRFFFSPLPASWTLVPARLISHAVFVSVKQLLKMLWTCVMYAGHTHSKSLWLDSALLGACRFTLKQSKVKSVHSDKLKGTKCLVWFFRPVHTMWLIFKYILFCTWHDIEAKWFWLNHYWLNWLIYYLCHPNYDAMLWTKMTSLKKLLVLCKSYRLNKSSLLKVFWPNNCYYQPESNQKLVDVYKKRLVKAKLEKGHLAKYYLCYNVYCIL